MRNQVEQHKSATGKWRKTAPSPVKKSGASGAPVQRAAPLGYFPLPLRGGSKWWRWSALPAMELDRASRPGSRSPDLRSLCRPAASLADDPEFDDDDFFLSGKAGWRGGGVAGWQHGTTGGGGNRSTDVACQDPVATMPRNRAAVARRCVGEGGCQRIAEKGCQPPAPTSRAGSLVIEVSPGKSL